MGMKGIPGLPAATMAKAYVDVLHSKDSGRVIELKPEG
jgi:hypothetical protein